MKKKPKPKPKRKPRQWKLKGWVAVPTEELKYSLRVDDLGQACRHVLCGRTKSIAQDNLEVAIRTEDVGDINYTILRLDITATAK